MKPHPKPAVDVPKWASLLVEAVNKPGMIMEAYSAFHKYSIANQILTLVQCHERGLEPGPINTFPGWQSLGRTVKRGERALTLCMPITRKVRDEESRDSETENPERIFTTFMYKPRWFVISQTVGDEFNTTESDFADTELTPKNLREVEAESVALLCCEALNLEGAAYCRGYIQNWLYPAVGFNGAGIPEKSAQKIFHAADQILRAGRLQPCDDQSETAGQVSLNFSRH